MRDAKYHPYVVWTVYYLEEYGWAAERGDYYEDIAAAAAGFAGRGW
jgi:hypothetical protein